jgi:hypothetical protein
VNLVFEGHDLTIFCRMHSIAEDKEDIVASGRNDTQEKRKSKREKRYSSVSECLQGIDSRLVLARPPGR